MKTKYPSIPDEAIVDLKVAGTFYRSLAQLLLGLSQDLKPEEYQAIVEKLKNKESAADIKELNIMLITALVFSIELAAEEQKVTKEIEIDIPDEPVK
jgi:hypothetical protein